MTAGDRTARRALLALVLVAAAALLPAFAAARPLNEVPVTTVSANQAESLAEPTAAGWGEVVPVEIPLASAPSDVPDAGDVSIDRVTVRAARTDERLYLRLSWPDGTADGNVSASGYDAPRINSFGDAAAVQLPLNTSERPGIAMGSSRSMVNVWYWNAEGGGEELLAAGPGTTTRLAGDGVDTAAAHDDGRWHVVFVRDLEVDGEGRTSIRMERDVSVAFAVWNGSNMERSGRKAVSEWHHLPFAPDPGAALYETVLWAVAGVAIVVVVLVTAMAVREGG